MQGEGEIYIEIEDKYGAHRAGESVMVFLAEGRSHQKATFCDGSVASKRTAIGVRKQPEANLDFLEGEANFLVGLYPHRLH